MLKLEIAGLAVSYKNVAELPAKVRKTLKVTQEKRSRLEQEVKLARSQERKLLYFLGETVKTSRSMDSISPKGA